MGLMIKYNSVPLGQGQGDGVMGSASVLVDATWRPASGLSGGGGGGGQAGEELLPEEGEGVDHLAHVPGGPHWSPLSLRRGVVNF